MEPSPLETTALADRLVSQLRGYQSCLVAFSAGVDSTVVAKAAQLALGDRALAVTGSSASLASGELEEAQRLAVLIGIRHVTIETDEFDTEAYLRNAPDRCYHCKTELYSQLEPVAAQYQLAVIANGANSDDLGDYRPGMQAATEHRVVSPLVECGINKQGVRSLAAFWELPVWDKPAAPCLSSRVAYGEAVTPERLAMIDQAEQLLRSRGLRTVRVRYHKGDLARLEVPGEALGELCQEPGRSELLAALKRLGFKYVTLDLEGFRSGSQNLVLPLVQLNPTAR